MNVFELAKKYYPRYWSKNALRTLVASGNLTREQYAEIVGEEYSDGTD